MSMRQRTFVLDNVIARFADVPRKDDYMLLGNLGDFLWSLLVIFFMVMYFMIMFQIIVDVFRSDMNGFGKAMWLLFILILPLIGMIVYLIANGDDMAKRGMRDAAEANAAFDARVRAAAGSSGGGAAQEIASAKQLLDTGAITQAEFDQLKAKALGS
jgi:ABC-type multidrug transport system fused ATPase/permease subunit